jgi:hypothetical protein
MRRTFAVLGFASVFGAAVASFTAMPNGASRASAGPHEATFLIPAADGYGVADCLSGQNPECGTVVANAWCEAQGFARAQAFGPARPETTPARSRPATPPRSGTGAPDRHHLRELSALSASPTRHISARRSARPRA